MNRHGCALYKTFLNINVRQESHGDSISLSWDSECYALPTEAMGLLKIMWLKLVVEANKLFITSALMP